MAVQDEQHPVHILFFPFLSPGHLIPIADTAAIFAARGVKCSILTTPVNAEVIRSGVDRANESSHGTEGALSIDIALVPFPDVGLPPGVECAPAINSMDDRKKFFQALRLLREPFDRFLAENRPDAVVSDSLYDWSADTVVEHGVPLIAFQAISLFARACYNTALRNNDPAEAGTDDDPDALVLLPGLPHRVELRRSQMMDPKKRPEQWAVMQRVNATEKRSYGEVFNSFHELEPDYVEHLNTTLGRRAWLVGPVALASKDVTARGASNGDANGCQQWLDAKPEGSVVYVSFGTLTSFSAPELRELARGLDMSGKNFIWVIAVADADESEWMPDGFAELMAPAGGRGLIIRGWAPQVMILNHPAVGGFMTHCGWTSTLEAVGAGVPMVTWPRYFEQFYNEKLIVEVQKVGVGVGSMDYTSKMETRPRVISGEVIAEAIGRVLGDGEEAEEIREKAKKLGEKARRAVEKGGSSYDDVGRLMNELIARRSSVNV